MCKRAFKVFPDYNPGVYGGAAVVAELADAQDLGSCVRKDVEVRVLSAAVEVRNKKLQVRKRRREITTCDIPGHATLIKQEHLILF